MDPLIKADIQLLIDDVRAGKILEAIALTGKLISEIIPIVQGLFTTHQLEAKAHVLNFATAHDAANHLESVVATGGGQVLQNVLPILWALLHKLIGF